MWIIKVKVYIVAQLDRALDCIFEVVGSSPIYIAEFYNFTIMTKKEVLVRLGHVITDLKMLQNGTWVPEKKSIDASRRNLEYVKDFLLKKKTK